MMILDADVEQLLVNYLAPALVARGFPVPVADTKTGNGDCVALYRAGGYRRDVVTDVPLVVFDVYASNTGRAARLILLVRALVYALEPVGFPGHGVDEVSDVRGPSNDPAVPLTDLVRYSMILSLSVRSGTTQ